MLTNTRMAVTQFYKHRAKFCVVIIEIHPPDTPPPQNTHTPPHTYTWTHLTILQRNNSRGLCNDWQCRLRNLTTTQEWTKKYIYSILNTYQERNSRVKYVSWNFAEFNHRLKFSNSYGVGEGVGVLKDRRSSEITWCVSVAWKTNLLFKMWSLVLGTSNSLSVEPEIVVNKQAWVIHRKAQKAIVVRGVQQKSVVKRQDESPGPDIWWADIICLGQGKKGEESVVMKRGR